MTKKHEVNQATAQAIADGANMFLIVIDEDKVLEIGDSVTCLKPLWSGTIGSGKYESEHIGKVGVVSHVSKDSNHVQVTYKDDTYSPFAYSQLSYLPLQVNDKFYIAEKRVTFQEKRIVNGSVRSVIFQSDFNDGKVCFSRENKNNLHGDFVESDFHWDTAESMQEHQSRHKDLIVTEIQIRRVKELSIDDAKHLTGYSWERVCEITPSVYIDEQHGQGFYESNPYIALISFKRGE